MLTIAQLTSMPTKEGAAYLLTHPHELPSLLSQINPDTKDGLKDLLTWANTWATAPFGYAVVEAPFSEILMKGGEADVLFAPNEKGRLLSKGIWDGDEKKAWVEIKISPRFRASLQPVAKNGMMIHVLKAFTNQPFKPLQIGSLPLR